MKIEFSKKTFFILINFLNMFLILFINLITPFSLLGDYSYGFFGMIANAAKNNVSNTVIFSSSNDDGKSGKEFADAYLSYYEYKSDIIKNDSMLLSLFNNYINFGIARDESVIVLLKNKLYASLQSDGNSKINDANIWYHGDTYNGSNNSITKGISITEAIADKILYINSLTSYDELKGITIDFKYLDQDNTEIIEKMYIRGVMINDKGAMPKIRSVYGDNIVMFYDSYYKSPQIEAHFYFNNSTYGNQKNFKLLESFGYKANIIIKKAIPGNEVDHSAQIHYQEFLNKNVNTKTRTLLTVTCGIIMVLISITISLILSEFNYSRNIFILLLLVGFMVNGVITAIISLNKLNPLWLMFDNPWRGLLIILYFGILSGLTYNFKKGFLNEKN